MELKSLNDYLSSKFSFKNNNKLRCDICKNFVGTNSKSLAAHQRKCKNKYVPEISSENSESESSKKSNDIVIPDIPKKKSRKNKDDDIIV